MPIKGFMGEDLFDNINKRSNYEQPSKVYNIAQKSCEES